MVTIARKPSKRASLVKALRPGVAALREIIATDRSGLSLEPLQRVFRDFKLDPNNEVDWKILATLLAVYFFDEGKKRGRHSWTSNQQLELLAEVHKRKQKNPLLTDEQACRIIARDKNSPAYFRTGPRDFESKGFGLVKHLRKARQRFQTNQLVYTASHLAFVNTGRI